MLDPADLITQFYPEAPFNFDVPPVGLDVGHLKAIFRMAGQYVQQFESDAEILRTNLTVQNAEGNWLVTHGLEYGVNKNPGESDSSYRGRVLAAMNREKCTLEAIRNEVLSYYQERLNAGIIAALPFVYSFDTQSDPTRSNELGIVRLDFVVSITFPAPSDGWFLDYGALTVDAWLLAETLLQENPEDLRLDQRVRAIKAAGTHLLYALRRAYLDFGRSSLSASATVSAKVTRKMGATMCIFQPSQPRAYLNPNLLSGPPPSGYLGRDAFLWKSCPKGPG